ncbi:MAG: hypothetical protein MN733_25490, partial [Nitrososphaera sp.]|nr:hypothetical protein [Nitrososphaera sp.]
QPSHRRRNGTEGGKTGLKDCGPAVTRNELSDGQRRTALQASWMLDQRDVQGGTSEETSTDSSNEFS